jgi:hypothetical protein
MILTEYIEMLRKFGSDNNCMEMQVTDSFNDLPSTPFLTCWIVEDGEGESIVVADKF